MAEHAALLRSAGSLSLGWKGRQGGKKAREFSRCPRRGGLGVRQGQRREGSAMISLRAHGPGPRALPCRQGPAAAPLEGHPQRRGQSDDQQAASRRSAGATQAAVGRAVERIGDNQSLAGIPPTDCLEQGIDGHAPAPGVGKALRTRAGIAVEEAGPGEQACELLPDSGLARPDRSIQPDHRHPFVHSIVAPALPWGTPTAGGQEDSVLGPRRRGLVSTRSIFGVTGPVPVLIPLPVLSRVCPHLLHARQEAGSDRLGPNRRRASLFVQQPFDTIPFRK